MDDVKDIELVDTHCHIQFPNYDLDPEEVLAEAQRNGVNRLLVVGCELPDSQAGVDFAANHDGVWASVGLHPHAADQYVDDKNAIKELSTLAKHQKTVAIGEIGLDYYYLHSSKADQNSLFHRQLDIAMEHQLPVIFHVREAFFDFVKVLKDYRGVRGVVHSFSAGQKELDVVLGLGLYVGLNGIMTFTTKDDQLAAARAVPLDRLLLETDAPFLTPKPFRGTICQPKHVRVTAEFLSQLRGESLAQLASKTTQNARNLFSI